MTENFTLFFSLISLGFFGGFSHCIGMCGPFVLTQVNSRLQKMPLEKFSGFERLKSFALLPYHLGRITTYSFLGFVCSVFTTSVKEFTGFRFLSAALLLGAAMFFLNLFFDKKFLRSPTIFKKIRLPFKTKFLKVRALFFDKRISHLFQNPQGLRGYALGLVLGFIPCGLLYAAFLIAGASTRPLFAATGMFLFGLSTFPSLFLTASGGYVLAKFPEFKLVAKALILLNIIMLILMAAKVLI